MVSVPFFKQMNGTETMTFAVVFLIPSGITIGIDIINIFLTYIMQQGRDDNALKGIFGLEGFVATFPIGFCKMVHFQGMSHQSAYHIVMVYSGS
jgi:hypothetical protein